MSKLQRVLSAIGLMAMCDYASVYEDKFKKPKEFKPKPKVTKYISPKWTDEYKKFIDVRELEDKTFMFVLRHDVMYQHGIGIIQSRLFVSKRIKKNIWKDFIANCYYLKSFE